MRRFLINSPVVRLCLYPAAAFAVGLALSPLSSFAQAEQAETKGDPYPLATCPVAGAELGSMGDPVVHVHEGREVRFCCAGCAPAFEDDPDQYLQQIDEQIVEQQKEHYPLETCLISGQELGSMGDPVEHVLYNRLVRLCCAGCVSELEENAEVHLAKLDEAVIEAQADDYALDFCLVSDEPLDAHGHTIDRVIANRLVRLCCPGCAAVLQEQPATVLAALDAGEPIEDAHEHRHDHGDDNGHDHDHGHDGHHH
ncbi:hypothetical protein ACERK3_07485 [Phycisphaerales bacterium AB-hyl4]|uniref:TRASH domain-containing protein n=1 Tax=Natronomicrosphaera hydrolytica TaxID=3242702 RepID=A0ABV4U5P8_9BACT